MAFKKKLYIEKPAEKKKIEKKEKKRIGNSFFRHMIRYAEPLDYFLVTLGTLSAIVAGFCWPITTMILGQIADVFLEYEYNSRQLLHLLTQGNATTSAPSGICASITNGTRQCSPQPMSFQLSNETTANLEEQFLTNVNWFAGETYALSVLYVLGHFVTLNCFQLYAARQIRIIKQRHFQASIRQEIGWHDRQTADGQTAYGISTEFKKLEIGINENLGMLIYNLAAGTINVVVGFYFGWKLSLVVISVSPIMAVVSIAMEKLQAHYMLKEMDSHSLACSAAEEVIAAIRTVFAFGGENRERKRYRRLLKPALKNGFRRNFVSSIASATMWGTFYLGQALGIWYGMQLIIADSIEHYTVGIIVIVLWSITGAGFNLGDSAPFIESFQNAKTAFQHLVQVMERQSEIDSLNSQEGNKLPSDFRADIEFKNVQFGYPSRPEVRILKGLDLKINCGEVVALVGSSGCGKSTLVQLLQRFYDPDSGEILLDGVNIKQLNVGWLREQMGVVGQEPVLFDDSIEQNIKLGMPTDQLKEIGNVEIQQAAIEANADDFILDLPEGYLTNVGDRGALLSGGQKQRIAIARALISNPRILLLDEATSALDLRSEHMVQTALDRASKGRTTIIVAHRLSTIQNADRIIYIDDGKVLEMGTHQELMNLESAYYRLVMAQQQLEDDESELNCCDIGTSDGHNCSKLSINPIKTDHCEANNNNNNITKPIRSISLSKQFTKNAAPSRTAISKSTSALKRFPPKSEPIHYNQMSEEDLKQWKGVSFPYSRIFWLIWTDKLYLLLAMFAAALYGLVTPIYAIIYGEFLDVFSQSKDVGHIMDSSFQCSMMLVGLAILIFVACIVQITFFGVVSGKLVMKLRTKVYSAILSQDIAWFDLPENSSGALCSKLEDDVSNIEGATGQRISIMCQAIVTLICAVIISFIYNWRLALVSLFLMPFIAITSVFSSTIYDAQLEQASETAKLSGKLTTETMGSIRTVTSLHKQQYFYDKFAQIMNANFREMCRKAPLKAAIIAVSNAVPMAAYATVILYGGYLIAWKLLKYSDFFRISESMIFGAMVLGETSVISGDFIKAKISAVNIFKIIDRKPQKLFTEKGDDDVEGGGEWNQKPFHSEGNISFRSAQFSYPNRASRKVLNGLTFRASQGEKVALVGSSGCGKSTTIQLLERFYDCTKGKILLDGENLNRLNVDWVRSQMALVSQEPILFSYSIKENIAYGDNSRSVVPFDEIVRAAQMANIHEFIQELPRGYDTPVGGKGSQLSGGQKQRIAIARALIRNPKILLLDEATSALDTESEQMVQQALDQASEGRTCIVIAHRLQTILGANKIVVINRGENIEEGTHEELFAKKGHYWKLYNSAQGSC